LYRICITGTDLFHVCLPFGDLLFVIKCPLDLVIGIRSVAVGFIPVMNDDSDLERCHFLQPTCTLSAEELYNISVACNELPYCNFSLVALFNDSQCFLPENGNVTRV